VNGQIQYGSRSPLKPAATPAGLTQFRHEVRQLTAPATRAELQRLLELARQLELQEDAISDELAEIRASFEALDFGDQISRAGLPIVISLEPLPDGELCHFVTPVRFGRRRNDQFGHLELTTSWLRFHGALDISVVWPAIASVTRSGRDIIVSLNESRRLLRFCCHALSEASRGGVVATHLLHLARCAERDAASGSAAV
jgi:hypothetical protein